MHSSVSTQTSQSMLAKRACTRTANVSQPDGQADRLNPTCGGVGVGVGVGGCLNLWDFDEACVAIRYFHLFHIFFLRIKQISAPVSKDQSLKRSTNTYIFIDVKTQKSASLLTQKHQRGELMAPLKLICMAGSQPLAVFLLGPGVGDNTKPANRMGPLRACAAGGGGAAISWSNLKCPDHVRDVL